MKKLKLLATVDEEELLRFLFQKTAPEKKLKSLGIFPETSTIQHMEHDKDSNKLVFHITSVAPEKLIELGAEVERLNSERLRLVDRTEPNAVPLKASKASRGKIPKES